MALRTNTPWKLTPSSFAWLWDSCKRCFYNQIVRGVRRPSTPFPSVFGLIDLCMKEFFAGRSTDTVSPDLRPGTIAPGDAWVRSQEIRLPGHETSCYIFGRLDTTISFDDGDFAIVDFKTTDVRERHLDIYGRQLAAYAFAAEYPAPRSLSLSPVTTLGLLCVQPRQMIATETGYAFTVTPRWVPIEKDEESFLTFLDEVLTALEAPAAPGPAPECEFCSRVAVTS
jgi:PD-(D/E)XK nuclease superfamily protein